jgi:hypothetical protein
MEVLSSRSQVVSNSPSPPLKAIPAVIFKDLNNANAMHKKNYENMTKN